MRVRIIGHDPVAEPLARLAERAGHVVRWEEPGTATSGSDDASDLVILAFSDAAIETTLANIRPVISQDVVVVDATIPMENERHGSGETKTASGTERIAAWLPHVRIVRAFASVPADALAALLNRSTSDQSASLAVPLAGDDREARALVAKFMRELGVEPFDLGALGSAAVLEPGGALWRKALSQVEMLEAVGWLSGDG